LLGGVDGIHDALGPVRFALQAGLFGLAGPAPLEYSIE
jgi:hypothetical protein